ncbi:DUF4430 domain-containing protein [Adhaeretor mobilis]|uniref:Transcobalamin-like C-terminal domain-containing protein n=1 Tax=Adhaeretor mobilis TaxID=1930276 RepID=A0A517MPH3_9BACT|nr:DUF4430 domain-containing protein [Adhaeretor mobilis]QDS96780.1 hypothetical protein HG15A2_00380 [Adhaeretor mobilis]
MSAKHDSPPEDHALRNNGPWWMYPVVLAGAVVIVALLADRTNHPPADAPEQLAAWTPTAVSPKQQAAGESVKLSIDFGNGAQRTFNQLPWKEGMTVADLMLAAQDFRPGIQFEAEGEGETAFLSSLEGVANGGDEKQNWLYRVNGEHAHVSYAVYTLQSGDEVQWIYARGQGE